MSDKKFIQSDEDRALAEIERRHAEDPACIESTIHERDDVTEPVQLIDMEQYQSSAEYREEQDAIVERYRRDPTYRALWKRAGRAKRDSAELARGAANRTLEVNEKSKSWAEICASLDEVKQAVHSLKLYAGLTKWVAGVLVITCLGSAIVVFTKVFNWGISTGEVEIRLDHLERDLNAVRNEPRHNWLSNPALVAPSGYKGTP